MMEHLEHYKRQHTALTLLHSSLSLSLSPSLTLSFTSGGGSLFFSSHALLNFLRKNASDDGSSFVDASPSSFAGEFCISARQLFLQYDPSRLQYISLVGVFQGHYTQNYRGKLSRNGGSYAS